MAKKFPEFTTLGPRHTWLVFLSLLAIASVGVVILLAKIGHDTQLSITARMDKIAAVAQLLSSVKDAETGERGYLVTRKPEYLEPYNSALKRLPGQYRNTRALFVSEPERLGKVDYMISLSERKIRGLGVALRIAREKGFDAAANATLDGTGRRTMDLLRISTTELIIAERNDQATELRHLGVWQTAFYAVAVFLILVTSGLLIAALLQSLQTVEAVRKDAEGKSLLLQEVLEYSPDLIFVKDREGRYSHANKATLSVMNRTSAIGLRDSDLYPEAVAKAISNNDAQAFHAPAAITYEESLIPAGSKLRRYYLTTKVAIRDKAGAIVGLLGISKDISERREAEEKQQLMINELNHRVKNTLAVLHSVALQSFKGVDAAKMASFEGRLQSMSAAHDILTRHSWSGARLRDIAQASLSPFCGSDLSRCSIAGPDVELTPSAALAIAMVFHELSTNAAKYGSLSVEDGRVLVEWNLSGNPPQLDIKWRELGGPAPVKPSRIGFGTKLIQRSFGYDPNASVSIDYAPGGLTCTVSLSKFAPEKDRDVGS